MFYRRKILLAFLESFGNELEKLKLQKLLMLFCQEQEKPAFHFVPYRYGCFSFQANADLGTLTKYEEVEEAGKSWKKTSGDSYVSALKPGDREVLQRVIEEHGKKSSAELIRYTYQRFPYYAINSSIASEYLSKEKLEEVNSEKPRSDERALYTIGYEGISLEEYLNKLIRHDVKVLCDVRRNAFSMKYGFSKSQLKNACEGVGIEYKHLPEVGIASGKRKELNSQKDYDRLFEDYSQSTLQKTEEVQLQILGLIENFDRVALTCFEADICQCHRKPLAESISNLTGFKYFVRHI